jgi:hypothetical protein
MSVTCRWACLAALLIVALVMPMGGISAQSGTQAIQMSPAERKAVEERRYQYLMEQRRVEERRYQNLIELRLRRLEENGGNVRAALLPRVLALREEVRRAGVQPFTSAHQIVAAINDYKRKVLAAGEGPDAGELHAKWAAELCVRLESTEVRGWSAKPIRLAVHPNDYDTLPLTAQLDEELNLWTIDSRRRDPAGDSQIRRGTPLYTALSEIKLNDAIKVSGHFLSSCDLNAFERDTNYYDLGFKFTSIEKQ